MRSTMPCSGLSRPSCCPAAVPAAAPANAHGTADLPAAIRVGFHADDIDAALARIGHKLRSLGEREVASRLVGELVMDELRHLDEVAYVRFASVYRNFREARDFEEFISDLAETNLKD